MHSVMMLVNGVAYVEAIHFRIHGMHVCLLSFVPTHVVYIHASCTCYCHDRHSQMMPSRCNSVVLSLSFAPSSIIAIDVPGVESSEAHLLLRDFVSQWQHP